MLPTLLLPHISLFLHTLTLFLYTAIACLHGPMTLCRSSIGFVEPCNKIIKEMRAGDKGLSPITDWSIVMILNHSNEWIKPHVLYVHIFLDDKENIYSFKKRRFKSEFVSGEGTRSAVEDEVQRLLAKKVVWVGAPRIQQCSNILYNRDCDASNLQLRSQVQQDATQSGGTLDIK